MGIAKAAATTKTLTVTTSNWSTTTLVMMMNQRRYPHLQHRHVLSTITTPNQDDLEYDMTKPIVSLSLGGRPCLFVVGGTGDDGDDAAGSIVPIILRPGDVVLMGGPHRLAYHAMTRILPLTLPAEPILPPTTQPVTLDDFHDDERDKNNLPPASDLPALQAFLQNHRININLRQVYPDGMDPREGRKGHSAEMKVGAD